MIFLTALTDIANVEEENEENNLPKIQVRGFFDNFEEARKVLKHPDSSEMLEDFGYFRYAVLEEYLNMGFLPRQNFGTEEWYERQDNKWILCEKPKELRQIASFAIF